MVRTIRAVQRVDCVLPSCVGCRVLYEDHIAGSGKAFYQAGGRMGGSGHSYFQFSGGGGARLSSGSDSNADGRALPTGVRSSDGGGAVNSGG